MHEIAISRPGGADLEFGPVRDKAAKDVQMYPLGVPEFHDFERCPVCGAIDDLTREHVPQGDLGGRVMTRTCGRCNNRLGSRVENELRDWFDDAVGSVRFSGGDIPGRRRVQRILQRATAEGHVGLFLDAGKSDADIKAMLMSGKVEVSYRTPDPKVWRTAALKHAYLGACLALRDIPNSPMAQQVRADLVAARDSKRGDSLPESRIGGGLRVLRSHRPAQGPPVVVAALVDDDGLMLDGGLSFAGTLFVSWPLEVDLFWSAAKLPADDNGDGER